MTPIKFNFSLPLALSLATVTTATLSDTASAALFNFSFSNVEGPVSGTVQGTLTLPDGDGTNLAATSLIVTSAPAALGYTLPFDVLANLTNLFANNFTVSGGNLTTGSFAAQNSSATTAFTLSFAPGTIGSILSLFNGGDNFGTGVVDINNSTLTFSSASTAPVPEPSAVIGLVGLGSAFLWGKGKKSA